MFKFLQGAADPATAENVRIVEPDVIRGWLDAGEAVLIDVREVNEYTAEHIPGALLNPLSVFDSGRIPDLQGKRLVIHCRSGQRCGSATMKLLAEGYKGEINRMRGGIIAWKERGGPVTAG